MRGQVAGGDHEQEEQGRQREALHGQAVPVRVHQLHDREPRVRVAGAHLWLHLGLL